MVSISRDGKYIPLNIIWGIVLVQYSAVQQVFDMTFYDSISICLQLLASVPHNHLLPTLCNIYILFFPPLGLPFTRPSIISSSKH